MNIVERVNIGRADRYAGFADTPTVTEPRDPRSLVVMMAALLCATVMILGVMWVNGARQEGASGPPVAEQHEVAEQRQ